MARTFLAEMVSSAKQHWMPVLALIVAIPIAMFMGALVYALRFPSAPSNDPLAGVKTEIEIERRVREQVAEKLRYRGVLEVKDGEAQTVLHRRTAAQGENGKFTDLPNGDFSLHWYVIREGNGYGTVEFPSGMVLVIWRGKPPSSKPDAIRLYNGRKVDAIYR